MSNEKIKTYKNSDGSISISRLESILAWRRYLGDAFFDQKKEQCPFCNGFGYLNTTPYGMIQCICKLTEDGLRQRRELAPYQSMTTKVALSDIKLWGSEKSQQSLFGAIQRIEEWMEWPNQNIAIFGIVGTGKTMMLSSIRDYFTPSWCLYINMTDFEILARDFDKVDEAIETIKRAPILLLDDIGADYTGNNTSWVRSRLLQVVDYRYNLHTEYPTAIATNYTGEQLMAYEPRIASRLLDVDRTAKIGLVGVNNWRAGHE